MAKKTIGGAFGEMRAEIRMTMFEIGNRCGLTESTISNIERDKPVRWETVHLALSVGMNIHPGSIGYQACHSLWLKARAERAESHTPEFGRKTLTKHGVEATRKFRQLIHDLDPAQTNKILASATRAARSL